MRAKQLWIPYFCSKMTSNGPGKDERNIEIARQIKLNGEPVEKIIRYTGCPKKR